MSVSSKRVKQQAAMLKNTIAEQSSSGSWAQTFESLKFRMLINKVVIAEHRLKKKKKVKSIKP